MSEWLKVTGVSLLWMFGGAVLGVFGSIVLAAVWGYQLVAEHGRAPGSDPLVGLAIGWVFLIAPVCAVAGATLGLFCRGGVELWKLFRRWREVAADAHAEQRRRGADA